MSNRKRRRHSDEFKQEAVKLITDQGYSTTEAARNLGLHENLLRTWKKEGQEGARRLIAVTRDRTPESLERGLETLGEGVLGQVQYVCSDMWKPYLNALAARVPQAVHVLDRFHIMQKFGKALDDIRSAESRQLKADGYERS